MYASGMQGLRGWSDIITDIIPAVTKEVSSIVQIFRPQKTLPANLSASSPYSVSGKTDYTPYILMGGFAIVAIILMRKKP